MSPYKSRYIDYSSWFEDEGRYRDIAEIFLWIAVGLSISDVIVDIAVENNWSNNNMLDLADSVSGVALFIVAIIGVVLEQLAIRKSSIGDYGRRAHFSLNLMSKEFRLDEERKLSKHYTINDFSNDDTYTNKGLGLTADVDPFRAKLFRFYNILFNVIESRKAYKPHLRKKYYRIWGILFAFVVVVPLFRSPSFNRVLFTVVIFLILSPYGYDTIKMVRIWDEKSDIFVELQDRLFKLNDISELHYLFLEYSMAVQDIFKVPNKIYEPIRDEIKSDLKNDMISRKEQFDGIGIRFDWMEYETNRSIEK